MPNLFSLLVYIAIWSLIVIVAEAADRWIAARRREARTVYFHRPTPEQIEQAIKNIATLRSHRLGEPLRDGRGRFARED